MSFGQPSCVKQLYPGVSAKRFNPVEANQCWAAAIRKEKESRSVHQLLDAHHKLGLDEIWAKDMTEISDMLPGQKSLAGVYKKLGWKSIGPGRFMAPDPEQMLKKRQVAQWALEPSRPQSAPAATYPSVMSTVSQPSDLQSTTAARSSTPDLGTTETWSLQESGAAAVARTKRQQLGAATRKEKVQATVRKMVASELAKLLYAASASVEDCCKQELGATAAGPQAARRRPGSAVPWARAAAVDKAVAKGPRQQRPQSAPSAGRRSCVHALPFR